MNSTFSFHVLPILPHLLQTFSLSIAESRDNANSDEFSRFPIMPNESFTFDYSGRRGVELEFNYR
jgi:hypothetical protein